MGVLYCLRCLVSMLSIVSMLATVSIVSIGCLYTLYSCIDTLRQSQLRLHVIYHGNWDLSAVDMVDKGGTRCSGVSE